MATTGEARCAGTYEDGWLVFANRDGDKVVDAGEDNVIQVFDGLPPGYRLTNRAGTKTAIELINYLPDGESRGNRTLLFCPPLPVAAGSMSIVINIVGRARLLWGRDPCPLA
jgi:Tfp pilus assembly protein FimT